MGTVTPPPNHSFRQGPTRDTSKSQVFIPGTFGYCRHCIQDLLSCVDMKLIWLVSMVFLVSVEQDKVDQSLNVQ